MSEALTYEAIVAAINADHRKTNPDWVSIEHNNAEYLSRMNPEHRAKFCDNIMLDWFGFSLGDGSACYTRADLKKLYEAAKIMFARHPGQTFCFDLDSEVSGWGSPWSYSCESPEEWVLVYARRLAETDEACIAGWSKAKAEVVLEVISDLESVGVPKEFLHAEENLMTACYDNRRLYWVLVPMLCELPKAA